MHWLATPKVSAKRIAEAHHQVKLISHRHEFMHRVLASSALLGHHHITTRCERSVHSPVMHVFHLLNI